MSRLFRYQYNHIYNIKMNDTRETVNTLDGKSHHMLSPSSAHRWLECLPSAWRESLEPEQESGYAGEGTLAHALAALKLRAYLGEETHGDEKEIKALEAKLEPQGIRIDAEMEEMTDTYLSIVRTLYREAVEQTGVADTKLAVETSLDLDPWIEGGSGTSDATIVSDGLLHVIDFKYGKGVAVDARENPQMKLYALGAYYVHSDFYRLTGNAEVTMTIVQPRIGNLSQWKTTLGELLAWGREEVLPKATLAAKGKGTEKPGDWCRFCKIKGKCAALADWSLNLWNLSGEASELDAGQLARILKALPSVTGWAEAVKEEAMRRALGGTAIPGYKLVEGRSVRRITEPDKLAGRLLADGIDADAIWKPRELRTLTELEKSLGKKRFAGYAEGLVEKPKGKPALVEESDKRKAIEPGDDFGGYDLEKD